MSKQNIEAKLRKINGMIDECVVAGKFGSKKCKELRRVHRSLLNALRYDFR